MRVLYQGGGGGASACLALPKAQHGHCYYTGTPLTWSLKINGCKTKTKKGSWKPHQAYQQKATVDATKSVSSDNDISRESVHLFGA